MRRALTLIAVLLVVMALPPEVRADFRQFIPKISNYAGFLTVDSSYENQEDTTNGRGIRNKDLFMRETLDFESTGYVYDPRFISFVLKFSGGVKQESFSTGPRTQPFKVMSARQYTFRMIVLPEHPYNLELFSLRVEPLTRRAFPQSESVAYTKGAIFRYRRKPYFFNAHYIDNTTESPVGTYSTTKYGAIGTYYRELGNTKFYSYAGSYEHTSFTAGGSADSAAFNNIYSLNRVSLSSSLTYGQSSQSQGGPFSLSLSNKTIDWGERAYVRLPWHFGSGISFIWSRNTFKTSGPNVQEQDLSSTTRNAAFTLTHKLYNSLASTYSFGYTSLKTDTGRSTTTSNNLGFIYSKEIPWGRMRAEVSGDRSNTHRQGVQAVPNELHSGVRVPGSFTLNDPDVDVTTIFIYLRSSFIPEGVVPLQENVDYIVEPFGNTVRITIFNLPSQFVVPGTYNFYVSYSLRNAQSRLVTTDLHYSFSLELFKKLFPYYNHSKSSQTVSGITDEVPWNYTSDVVGFMYVTGPLNVSASYMTVRSTVNPSKGWRTNVSYVKDIAENTQFQAAGNYSEISYPQGTGVGGVSYTERLFGVSAGFQRRFVRENMNLSLLGTYSRDEAIAISNTYAFTSNYSWKVGKVFLTAGATASFSNSSFPNNAFSEGNSRRVYQYYYLSVKRKLF